MRILVTSGGTRVPLDEVRWLANRATGGLGSGIARAWLRRGAQVTLLAAQDAILPDRIEVAMDQWDPDVALRLEREAQQWRAWRTRYHHESYVTFHDYAAALERILGKEPFDVCLLTAAVSDYAPVPQVGKMESDTPTRTIAFERLPKLIDRVKDWQPRIFLVGFKLLAGVDQKTLLTVARSAHRRTRADLTVANDTRSIDAGGHILHLLRSDVESDPVETLGPAKPAIAPDQPRFWHPDHPLAEPLADRILDILQSRPTDPFPKVVPSGGST